MSDTPAEIITVRPHQGGWQVFEGEDARPCFGSREDAISHAESRALMRKIDIQLVDSTGAVERIIRQTVANRG